MLGMPALLRIIGDIVLPFYVHHFCKTDRIKVGKLLCMASIYSDTVHELIKITLEAMSPCARIVYITDVKNVLYEGLRKKDV